MATQPLPFLVPGPTTPSSEVVPCYNHLRVSSELNLSSVRFMQHYQITPTFDTKCAECCWCFLTKSRQYEDVTSTILPPYLVKFGDAKTKCYVDGPQSIAGVHGMVKTEHVINLGSCGPRSLSKYHSYQLYGLSSTGLSLGMTVRVMARIEAIFMPGLISRSQLQDCYFSYADAALLELYRQSQKVPLLSLMGQCCQPPPPSLQAALTSPTTQLAPQLPQQLLQPQPLLASTAQLTQQPLLASTAQLTPQLPFLQPPITSQLQLAVLPPPALQGGNTLDSICQGLSTMTLNNNY